MCFTVNIVNLEVSTEQCLFYEGGAEFALKTGEFHPLTPTWPVQRHQGLILLESPLGLEQDTLPWHKKQTAFEQPGKALGCGACSNLLHKTIIDFKGTETQLQAGN